MKYKLTHIMLFCLDFYNHIFLQYGGPDGELAASLRYLSQRFSMPYPELKAILTDIGTEESVPTSVKFFI